MAQKTIINGITFYNKKDVRKYMDDLMKRNVNCGELQDDDLKFTWELIMENTPEYLVKAKKLWRTDGFKVGFGGNHTKNLHLFMIDQNRNETPISVNKAISNLKFEESDKEDESFITFGKYKGRLLEDVIDNDTEYFLWLEQQSWLDPKLKILIETHFTN